MLIKRKLTSNPKYDWEIEIEQQKSTTTEIIDSNKDRNHLLQNRNKYGNRKD